VALWPAIAAYGVAVDLRAADIFLENGVHIETGPHKNAIQQTFGSRQYFDRVIRSDCFSLRKSRHSQGDD
jgi:hypothetical protein